MDPRQAELIKDPNVRKFIMDSIKWVDVKRYDDLDAIEDKIEVGSYKGKTLYIGREVYHEVVCGSYVTHVLSVGLGRCLMIKDTAYLTYYEETTCVCDEFQVATASGDARYFHWVARSGDFNLSNFPVSQGIPVPAGEMGGKLAYIARARVQDVDDEYRKSILPYPILEGEQVREGHGFRLESQGEYEVLAYIGPPPPTRKPPFMAVGDVLKQGGGFGH